MTSVTTWNIPFGTLMEQTSSFSASLISLSPSSTAFALFCSPCSTWTPTITLGPWAQITPPPDLPSSGVFDVHIPYVGGDDNYTETDTLESYRVTRTIHPNNPTPWTDVASWHCGVSSAQLTECVSMDTSIGPGRIETTFMPFTFGPDSDAWGFTALTVTITAGLEKAGLTPTTTGTAMATGGSKGGASGTAAETGSGTATATARSNAAGSRVGSATVKTMGLLGVALAALICI